MQWLRGGAHGIRDLQSLFVNGNKRTGVAAAALLLAVNGYRLETTNADLVQNPLRVAQSRYTIEEIAAWLRSRMRPAV